VVAEATAKAAALSDQQALLDQLVPLEPLVRQVHKASLEKQVQKALRGLKESLGRLDRKANRVYRGKSVHRAYRAKQDHKAKLALKVSKAYRARLELLVNKVHKESKVKQVLRVLKVIQENKGRRAMWVRQVLLEILDQQGLRALREQRALKVKMVFQLIKLLLLMGSQEQKRNGWKV
jgi:hypothetical protein